MIATGANQRFSFHNPGILLGLLLCMTGTTQATDMATDMAPAQVPVEAFAQASKTSMPRMSPDGAHLAVVVSLGDDTYALNVFRIGDMTRVSHLQLPRHEIPSQIAWVDNTRLVLGKGRLYGSIEQPMPTGVIIATDFDGKNQTYVYGPEQGTRTHGLPPGFGFIEGLPEKPNGRFYMRTYSRSSKRSTLYEVDARKTTHRELAGIGEPNLSFILRHDGTPIYAIGTDDNDQQILMHSMDGKHWNALDASKIGGQFVPVVMSGDDSKVYGYFSDAGKPFELVLADPSGQSRTVLARNDLNNVGRLLYQFTPPIRPFGVWDGGDVPKTTYFDDSDLATRLHRGLEQALTGMRVVFVDQTQDGSRSLLRSYSDRDPGAWYLYDAESRALSKVLIAREGIDPQRMGERRAFQFQASDGLSIAGFMTLPAGITDPAKLPTVLLPHGGPHVSGDDWGFDNDAQFLASRGYLVLQINFRGSTGRGRNFEEAGYLKWGTRIQEDLIDGLRWAIHQGYSDPSRICTYGASFGAYSAMMVASKAPDLVRCAVGYAGLYDLPMMYTKGDIRQARYGRNYLTRVIGRDSNELAANSPTTRAAMIKAPVLLIHGEADERTPIEQAKAMRKALQASGNSPEWMAVEHEGHGFYSDPNRIAMYQRLEAFLAMHLKAKQPDAK